MTGGTKVHSSRCLRQMTFALNSLVETLGMAIIVPMVLAKATVHLYTLAPVLYW